MILAEAYRRNGNTDKAHSLLIEAQDTLSTLPGRMHSNVILERLAIGFAILGDADAAREVLGEFGAIAFERQRAWYRVAPLLACHGLLDALEAVDQSGATTPGYPGKSAMITNVLIAAAASGQADEAYTFASGTDSYDRSIWLVAVLIGLIQAEQPADSTTPCPTLNTLPK